MEEINIDDQNPLQGLQFEATRNIHGEVKKLTLNLATRSNRSAVCFMDAISKALSESGYVIAVSENGSVSIGNDAQGICLDTLNAALDEVEIQIGRNKPQDRFINLLETLVPMPLEQIPDTDLPEPILSAQEIEGVEIDQSIEYATNMLESIVKLRKLLDYFEKSFRLDLEAFESRLVKN